MNFVRIFVDQDCLLSVLNDNKELDEFSNLFEQWTDIEYLEDFFSTNENDLKRSYWDGITIEQAIIETRREAVKFRKYLKRLSKRAPDERVSIFSRLFKPLDKAPFTASYLDKKKVYGPRNKTWLRIYALRIGDDMYVITGGAIKLTDNMREREHTLIELGKLETCLHFLKSQGICDEEGMVELLEL